MSEGEQILADQGATSVVVETFEDPISAQLAKGRLEAEYIPCHLVDLHLSSLDPTLAAAVGHIKLLVPLEFLERALTALEITPPERGFFIDDEEAALFEGPSDMGPRPTTTDLTCPECFSLDIALTRRTHLFWIVPLLLICAAALLPGEPGTVNPMAVTAAIVAMGGLFTGFALLTLRGFPLRCQSCGHRGRREEFYLMSDG